MAEDLTWLNDLIVDNNSPPRDGSSCNSGAAYFCNHDVSENNMSIGSWYYKVGDEGRGALVQSQPETNIGNIHEDATDGVQAAPIQLVQESRSSQASHQHQGNNRGRKRRRQGELSPIDKGLNDIKNLNHCIDRREKKLKDLKSRWQLCIQLGMDKETQKAFCNRWAQQDDLMTLKQFDEELKQISSWFRSKKRQSSTEEIPLELTKSLKIIGSTLVGINSKLNQETKEVDNLAESVAKEEIDTDSLRGKTLDDYTTVNISEFESLEKDLETCKGWSIPKSLEPIPNKIQLACGKDATKMELPCLVTLCAAVREMLNVQQIEQLSKPNLLRWVGAINKGFEMGFKFEPAKRDLKQYAYAYYGSKPGVYEKLRTITEELETTENKKIQLVNKKIQLEAQREEVEKCVDAAQKFEGSLCLSNSLFN
ncbi:hypothetical protein COLO4_24337 [Corchorus olitorius]|uniref:Uncharacterized protein n=1 Tax=Corchorus olitorius TaxID=93759 RepID=A0A1R3IAU0_9ROSI|nr:hypothetical protein COLO4_24337 [Corchorus olitorius]